MEIYGCLQVRKTRSDTSICVKKSTNLCFDEGQFITRTSALAVFGRRTLESTHHWDNVIDEILGESSADDSDEEFEDFIKIFQREEVLARKSVSSEETLKTTWLRPLASGLSNIGSRNSFVGRDIPGFFSSTELFGMMNCRSSGGSSRNAYTCLHPGDFYIKHKIPKREPKSYGYVKCVNQYTDNQSKYRANRHRSLSPNLPKLPYLEKPVQYSNSPLLPFAQRKTRIQFKNRSFKNNPSKPIKNASKKSIPDHALMRSLLSGLSIFDNENEVSQCYSKNLHKHKSMGNIKSSSVGSYQLKEGCCKSNVDLRDSALESSGDACGNFKDFYDNQKRQVCLKVDQRHNCCCADSRERYRIEPNVTCVECMRSGNEYGQEVVMGNRPQRRSTLVERRRNFFENREKQVGLETIKMKPTALVGNCVEKRIQNDIGKNDEITEIYRNFRSVQSTSTLSKRSSSLPPVSRFRRCNGMNSDLFNPDYNFCCENNNSSNGLFRNSIIETIRSKIFQNGTAAKSDCNDNWSSEPTHYVPRFPKETRTAMSIILSNKNSSISCRLCREKFRKKQLSNIETQTSPQISQHQLVPDFKAEFSKLPCPKNLLCDRGFHDGRCEESVRRRLKTVCDKRCVCKENRLLLECGDGSPWPGQAVRSREEDCLYPENAPEEFLGMIRPDLDTSEEIVHCAVMESPLPQTSVTMNGLNGHTNGDLNGCGDIITQNQQRGCWTIGLINSKYKYLTAETFGFKINANGASLKKKQIWTLEPDTSSGNDTCVYLKSHLDKYLAVDSFGNVTCENEEKEPGSKFQVVVAEDNTGRWAFRNVVRGYFLGSSSDKLTCTAKVPGDSEYWHIHLAARPQVNLRSVGRKRFAHLSENLDEIHVDANIPWGEDTLFTLEFHADEDGKYALHTCNNKYLSNGGKLVDACNKDCLFAAEYHSGQLALRDRNGQYLSPIGSKAMLKTRSNTVTKDELFSLEDSLPQASFVAALNTRYVSVKQGVDVTANQDEISDHEMFQLEFDWSTKRWYIRTMQDKYWTLETGGGIQASGDKRSSNALFDLVWQGDGSLAFRANNGRYVMTKRSGHLYATSDVIDENCKYYFYLINRPILVLKCEQGFVGYRAAGNPKLECNKATYECIQVERAEKGVIYFKGQNGKYWHVDSEGVTADTDTPEGFYLELREPTRLSIKSTNGNYLTASKNGLFRLGDSNFENATQWEY